jgi:predicted ester cyclase/catechol 2,3-dioxygenase-like lactoylglutathione lyase family enzyme
MIDHVGLFVNEYNRSKTFYLAMLRPLGYELLAEVQPGPPEPGAPPREGTANVIAMFGPPNAGKPFQITQSAGRTAPTHVALRCPSREVVDAVYRAGIGAGGRDNGRPGPRDFMPPNYYGGFLFDPDGNELEPLCWVSDESGDASPKALDQRLEDNKSLVRRFYAAIERPGATRDTLDEFVAPEFVNHGVPPGFPTNREGLKMFFEVLRKGFPDGQSEFHHLVAEGDMVMAHKVNHGSHLGEFMGMAPTGKRVHTESVKMFQIKNCQIVAHWHVVDVHGLMVQIMEQAPASPNARRGNAPVAPAGGAR